MEGRPEGEVHIGTMTGSAVATGLARAGRAPGRARQLSE